MRSLGLLRRNQKVLPYLAGEFPYFLATGQYGARKTPLLATWFRRWDAYLCVGPMVADLVRQVLPPNRHADILTFPNFIRDARLHEMSAIESSLGGARLTFVGNGPGGFRIFYKGLDLLLEAVARVSAVRRDVTCSIVGDWDQATRTGFSERFGCDGAVRWEGATSDLAPVLRQTALYVHCGRGDAWPNTVMEAMAAGVPALVSEWTGGRETVARIEPRLVAPLDARTFAERILWYLSLDTSARRLLGDRSREIVRNELTQSASQLAFRSTVRRALERFGMSHLTLPEGSR